MNLITGLIVFSGILVSCFFAPQLLNQLFSSENPNETPVQRKNRKIRRLIQTAIERPLFRQRQQNKNLDIHQIYVECITKIDSIMRLNLAQFDLNQTINDNVVSIQINRLQAATEQQIDEIQKAYDDALNKQAEIMEVFKKQQFNNFV